VYGYSPKPRDDAPIIETLVSLAEKHPRYGFHKLLLLVRRLGHGWNHKRVYRVYCELKLNLRRKGKNGYRQGIQRSWLSLIRPMSAGL